MLACVDRCLYVMVLIGGADGVDGAGGLYYTKWRIVINH